MPPDKREAPPGGSGAPLKIVLATSLDSLRFNPPALRKQPRPRRRRSHLKVLKAYKP